MRGRTPLVVCALVSLTVALGACGSSNAQSPSPASQTGLPSVDTTTTEGISASPTASPSSNVATGLTKSTYVALPAARTGGTLTIGAWQWPDSILPYFARNPYDLQIAAASFDGLVKTTPDLRYVPDLVTVVPTLANGGVKLVGSGMDVTWNLVPGGQWSDGQPITCDDIKATWQWVMDPANKSLVTGTVGWQQITGVDGGSGTTCVMHFGAVYEGYLSLVNPLLPAHYLSSVPIAQAKAKLYAMDNLAAAVFSGPYIPDTVDAPSKITFRPNPKWVTLGGHAPYLDSVVWRFYGDTSSMAVGFLAGDIGFAQNMTEADLPSLASVPPEQVVARDSSTYELLAFNRAAFLSKYGSDADEIIRSIELAVDRTAIASTVLQGDVSVTNDFVPEQSWYHESLTPATTLDVSSARIILANLGWTAGPNGVLAKNGRALSVELCTTTRQVRVATLTEVAAQLKQIGVQATVHTVAASTLFGTWSTIGATADCNLSHGTFDIAEFSYVSSMDPAMGYTTYVSSQTPESTENHTGLNLTRVANSTLDQAYGTIVSTVDPDRIKTAMAAIQRVYESDQNTFELPLYFHKDVWLASPKLHNFVGGSPDDGGTWNIGDWWLG